MRSLLRNQHPVFYRNYVGNKEILDDRGNPTGSFIPEYGDLKSAMLCVSPNKGSTEVEQFGTLENYDRAMTTSDTKCDINEDSILWLDGADTDEGHNYVVIKVAPWKNSIQYAIRKVTVSKAGE